MSNRSIYKSLATATRYPGDWTRAYQSAFHPDAQINVVHPFNEQNGLEGYLTDFVGSLKASFSNLYRRDDIVMAGQFEGGDWISSTGYWVGQFDHPWLGITPTGHLTYLRYGEFHRIEGGRIAESYVFLDIPELMISVGQWPIKDSPGHHRGHTGMIQPPATQDGLMWQDQDTAESQKSYQIVSDMLLALATEDERWRPYWHDTMMWYGPGAFGSFVGIEAFASFQVPFESAFAGWSGGLSGNGMTKHFTRYGDGLYACSGGWPSLTGVNVKPFLDQPPSNERVFMRVCDWWRRDGDLLVENWVFVDIPHVLLQLGYDVFEEIKS